MSAPIIYKSTDGNAPVLCGQRTSVVEVLTKCLVTGYGDKPAAGWTRPYVDANGHRASFRNSPANGTGFFLNIDQSAVSNGRYVYLSAFEMMTSESSGTLQFIPTSTNLYVSNLESTLPRQWVLMATDTWMLFVSSSTQGDIPTKAQLLSSPSSWTGLQFCFGDLEKYHPSDAYACFGGYSFSSGPIGTVAASSSSAAAYYRLARKLSGVAGGIDCAAMLPPPVSGGYRAGAHGIPYNAGSGLLVGRMSVNDGAANTLRGFWPKILAPLHPQPFENLETVMIGGKPHVALMWSGYSNVDFVCQILVDVSEG